MAITIPAGAFANSAAPPAATRASAGLDALQLGAEAMASVRQAVDNLALAMSADADAATAAGALAKARSALAKAGPVAGDDPFTKTLQEAELLRARGRGKLAVQAGIASLVGAIKQLHGLPLPSATRAELGRALIGRAVRHGLIGHDQQAGWDEATTSSLAFEPARKAIAATSASGEALAIVEAAKTEGALNQLDSETLDALAAQRRPVEVHRHHARLAWKERDDLAAFARGELPEPLGEESFRLIHGARGAVGAHARYQAARREAPAMAQIRGQDPEAIEAARDEWHDDPAIFEAAVEKDAAARRHDPAGYALATVAGLAEAYDETPEAERGNVIWSAQANLGIPEEARSPWTAVQEDALATEWDASPAGDASRYERVAFFKKHLLSLPLDQRSAAIRRMIQQGIVDGTELEVNALLANLQAGYFNAARRTASGLHRARPATRTRAPGVSGTSNHGESSTVPIGHADASLIPAYALPLPILPLFGTSPSPSVGEALEVAWDSLVELFEPSVPFVPPDSFGAPSSPKQPNLYASPVTLSAVDQLTRSGLTTTEAKAVVDEIQALQQEGAFIGDLLSFATNYATLQASGSSDPGVRKEAAEALARVFRNVQSTDGHMTLAELALIRSVPDYVTLAERGAAWLDDNNVAIGDGVLAANDEQLIIETEDGLLFAWRTGSGPYGRYIVDDALSPEDIASLQNRASDGTRSVSEPSTAAAGSPGEDPEKRESKDTVVYRQVDPKTGETRYVGITRRFEARSVEWLRARGYQVTKVNGLGLLTRAEAKGVEQALIEFHKLLRPDHALSGGTLENRIAAIAATTPRYAKLLAQGVQLLRDASYPGF